MRIYTSHDHNFVNTKVFLCAGSTLGGVTSSVTAIDGGNRSSSGAEAGILRILAISSVRHSGAMRLPAAIGIIPRYDRFSIDGVDQDAHTHRRRRSNRWCGCRRNGHRSPHTAHANECVGRLPCAAHAHECVGTFPRSRNVRLYWHRRSGGVLQPDITVRTARWC